VEQVRSELIGIRRGQALARPTVVLELSPQIRGHLLADEPRHGDTTSQISALLAVLHETIESLNPTDRTVLNADFNLADEHSAPTLTERRQSLAATMHVSFRTITRTADKALDTLSLALVTRHQPGPGPTSAVETPDHAARSPSATDSDNYWRVELARFWGLRPSAQVDIVCSEIPESERPSFAHPQDRDYLRYAKFADLDSLIYIRTSLASLNGDTPVRDYTPSEYRDPHDSQADRDHALIIVGGPPRNATYRQFQRDLPCDFQFQAEDRSLLVPTLGLTLRPHWTPDQELVEDLAVFTRLTFAKGLTIFLLGGCLTFGVLVAAQCFLHRELGARNVRYVHNHAGDDDFVVITETRRFGDITDVPDFATVGPILLMSRRNKNGPFTVLVDNSSRYSQPF
jgi:hypothetical protein